MTLSRKCHQQTGGCCIGHEGLVSRLNVLDHFLLLCSSTNFAGCSYMDQIIFIAKELESFRGSERISST